MSSYVELLFQKYQSKGLLIDANLLLLYLVGSYDTRLIGDGKYNKLSKYTAEDFNLLLRLRAAFAKSVTTAHVLTEVSILTNDLPESTKSECLSEFLQVFGNTEELTVASFEAAKRPEFRYLGLTDCALAEVSNRFLLVTDDARLVGKLGESGLEALNFNHLREYLLPR
jgi:hypothetical protein